MIKGLPNSKNICWFNSVMVTVMNTIAPHKALDLKKSRPALFWKKVYQLTSYLSIWGDKNDLTKKEHLSMIEEYFQLTSMFHIGRQEDATEFCLQASMFIDCNNEEFVEDVLYKQNICCLICDERSQHMEDGNRLIYLALDVNGIKESSILDR